MSQKTVVITGANAGIGFSTALRIAHDPCWHVVLACRDPGKRAAAQLAIQDARPKAEVTAMALDLFSLDSVRQFAAELPARRLPPLHGLILNAGGINMKAKGLEFSPDGYERIFQLNFLGHFLLVRLLLPQLAPPGRVVFVSSDLHDPAATKMGRFMKPTFGPIDAAARGRAPFARLAPMARYGTAKMFAMMTAYELARRLEASGREITVNSWSPGVVPDTQAGRDMPAVLKAIMMSGPFVRFMGSHRSSREEAGRLLGGLVTDSRYEGVTGRYFDGPREIPSSVESRDPAKQRQVWQQASGLLALDLALAQAS